MSEVELQRFPWVRPLVTEYARNFNAVASLFAGNPSNSNDWRSTIARVSRASRDRAAMHSVLVRQLEARNAPNAARESANRLKEPNSVAIVTGQQAGLFGGPLYTVLKAATAIQLARRIEQEQGVPVVPIFWVEAEDHDWNEVKTARVLNADFNVVDISAADPDGAQQRSVGQLVFGHDITATVDELERVLAPSEFSTEVLTAIRRRYQPGAAPGSAFAGLMDDVFGAQGLVVFEANDVTAKPLTGPIFAREIDRPSETARLANEAGSRMTALGHQPQVQSAPDSVALFYLDGARREPIRRNGSGFVIGSTERPATDLSREATEHPERFSPNVLLRPLVQDQLFPTICYVAGPSELAYQAQLLDVYRAFEIEPPLLYSRVSATLVDSAAAKFLERSKVPLEELQVRDESALNRLLERALPADIERTIDATQQLVAEQIQGLKNAATAVDPTLSGAVDTTVDRIRDTLKTLQSKIVQASKRKDDTLRRQFIRTQALTFPGGEPQERSLSLVFFLNRYGLSLGERLLPILPIETDKHYVITL